MLVEHRGKRPSLDPTAYVAPNAVLSGDVRIGPESRVLFGAVLTAEDGFVELGARCVVMENALLRGRAAHPVRLGDDVLVGPHAHVNGSWSATAASSRPAYRCFPARAWGATWRCASTALCTSTRCSRMRRSCRSAGWRWANPRAPSRRGTTTRSGAHRKRSTSHGLSTGCRGARRRA